MDINLKLDPTADNYLALANALAMAANARLIVQPGTYPIVWTPDRWSLRVPAGCTLVAEHVYLNCASLNPQLFAMFVIDADDIAVTGLALNGECKSQSWYTPSYWALLAVRQAQRVTLTSCTLSNSQKFGLDAVDVTDLTLEQCKFVQNGYADEPQNNDPMPLCGGVRISASNQRRNQRVVMTGCAVEHNGGEGAIIGRVDDLLVNHCKFAWNGLYDGHGNQDGLALSGIIKGSITHNTTLANRADGIVLSAGNTAETCSDVVLSHNKARANGGNGILLFEHDTPIGGELANIAIQHNTCADNGQMLTPNYPFGYSGIRLGSRGFGRIHDICLRANKCYDSRAHARTQLCGIDMLPAELQPHGQLGDHIILDDNKLYNNQYMNLNLWQMGLVA